MQVVILCGGQGTRIRDVAEDIPKPMVHIGDRPILWHIMKGYAECGFTDFVLCLGYKSMAIKRYFLEYFLANSNFTVHLASPLQYDVHGSLGEEDWRVTLVDTGLDAMTGCRVKRIENYITEDNFHLTYGDGVADVDINALVEFHRSHGKIGTVTAVQPPGRFGEIAMEGDRVVDFMEKPMQAPGRISGGFFVFHRQIFGRLKNDPSPTSPTRGRKVCFLRDSHTEFSLHLILDYSSGHSELELIKEDLLVVGGSAHAATADLDAGASR